MKDRIRTCVKIERLSLSEQIFFRVVQIVETARSMNDMIGMIMPTRSYTPTAGDKIYFVPGCEVPRFKVKQLCEKYSVALVKYKEKANVKFIGPDSIRTLLTDLPHQTYSREAFLKYLLTAVGNIPEYQPMIAAIRESTATIVAMNYSCSQALEKGSIGPKWTSPRVEDAHYYFKDEKSYELFMSVVDDPQLYNQNEILSRINTGGVMGQQEFESIKRMLTSTDHDNLRLAMEAMANCDYQKSCVPLLLLIKEYGSKMDESRTKNHVNFKSLLKFFEIQNLQSFSLNDILKSLLKRKLLNKINLDMLMPMAIAEARKNLKTEFFKIPYLEPSKQVTRGLQENVLDEDPDVEIVEEPKEQLTPKLLSLNL